MKRFLIALPLAALLALPALGQQSSTQSTDTQAGQAQSSQTATQSTDTQNTQNPNAKPTDRQPLAYERHEGFWGKINPFARKKYVQRQLDPIRARTNELDELTANNSKAIKDVDARATEGIKNATNKASEADQHAMAANQRAQTAHQTAQQAATRLQTVEQVVGNIDDYKPASQTEIRYKAGSAVLSKNAKQALDEMAANVGNQRGYIIQIEGYAPGHSQAAIQSSQTMAQAVERYLVLQHQIPVYRIFVVGMGNTPMQTAQDQKPQRVRAGRVDVTLMKNNVGQLAQSDTSSNAAPGEANGMAGAAQGGAAATPAATPSQGAVGQQPPQQNR